MNGSIHFEPVPEVGPLSLNAVYRRADLHVRFGGNRYSGIVTSQREPVILLFHTKEPTQQFYSDGFDENGVYWYSGEGTTGDMSWTAANRAVREHSERGFDLLFFERAQRKDGLWRFVGTFYFFSHKEDRRVDKEGKDRSAIIFGLLPLTTETVTPISDGGAEDLARLRQDAQNAADDGKSTVRVAIQNIYMRSEAVRRYALVRASGICEACGCIAPFKNAAGTPFLEVHHIDRLADDGPDRLDKVAAVCPNCHRRCHYSIDRLQYNSELRTKIATLEERRN